MTNKYMPTLYIDNLIKKKQYKKMQCALDLYYCIENDTPKTISKWSERWSVSRSTAWAWLIEFESKYDEVCGVDSIL